MKRSLSLVSLIVLLVVVGLKADVLYWINIDGNNDPRNGNGQLWLGDGADQLRVQRLRAEWPHVRAGEARWHPQHGLHGRREPRRRLVR